MAGYLDDVAAYSSQANAEIVIQGSLIADQITADGQFDLDALSLILAYDAFIDSAADTEATDAQRLGPLTAMVNQTPLLPVPIPLGYASLVNFNPTPSYTGFHNDLLGIQGGLQGQYYHLSLAQVNKLNGLPISTSFQDLQGDPYDNTALAAAFGDKQDGLPFDNNANHFLNGQGSFIDMTFGNLEGIPTTLVDYGISASDPLFDVKYLRPSTVLSTYALGPNSPLLNTDSITQMFGKIQGQINALSGGGGGSGTVTSVDVAFINGDSVGSTGGPITTSGAIDLDWRGTASDYITGEGMITDFASAVDAVVASGYVPYTGATGGVDLNAQDLGNIGMLTSGTLSYVGSNVLASFQTSVNSYNQFILQNTSAGTSASSDFIVSNDVSTDTTTFGDFGINSSTFSGTGSLSSPNAVYLSATSSDLVLGTTTANYIRFVYNGAATDAFRIEAANRVVIPSFATAGVVLNSSAGLLSTSATLSPTLGGTGVANNAASTITISGAFATTLTITGATGVTLPTTGTLATLAGSETFTNKTLSASSNVLGGVTLTLGSDASFDMYYRSAGGVLTRLANGTTGQVLTATTGSAPSWATGGGGSGDVVGPGSATDNAIARFDTTTGKLIQNSAVTIADTTGVIAGTQGVILSGTTSGTTTLVANATAGSGTSTLPTTTTTLAGLAVTQTFTASQTISFAGSFTTASLIFGGSTNNWISFGTTGAALPSMAARTAGYKVVLYAGANGSSVLDYAMGVGSGTFWFTTGASTDSYIFYAPISSVLTNVFAVSGTGNVSLRGNLTFSTATASGTIQISTGSTAIMSQNYINLGVNGGTAAPALVSTNFGSRSLGTRVILQSTTSTSQADIALGYNTNSLWFSTFDTSASFTWYGGATLAMTLSGAGTLTLVGGFAAAYAAKTLDYTLVASDYAINFTGTSVTKTITLPTAVGVAGKVYIIKNSGTGNTITIATTSSQTIDGVTTKSINTQYSGYMVQSDGANWIIISAF